MLFGCTTRRSSDSAGYININPEFKKPKNILKSGDFSYLMEGEYKILKKDGFVIKGINRFTNVLLENANTTSLKPT